VRLFINKLRVSYSCVTIISVRMGGNEEMEASDGGDVVSQLFSTKTSTLALMTTSIVLFVTLIAKRISGKQSEVIMNYDLPRIFRVVFVFYFIFCNWSFLKLRQCIISHW